MRGTGKRVRTRRILPPLVALLAAVLGACSNTPPPPVVTSPAAQTTTAKNPSQIVFGVDDISGGFNPHNIADSSTVTSALAQLVLPSVFRSDDTGKPVLDKSLMRSAEVISQQPFTVAYEIKQEASWSDGAPIAVEDFIYLYNQMRDNPGVVQPAGYRQINNIQPGEGGKRVEVTFSKPYPGWQTLFSNLMPSHLLKDAPGGWQNALEGGFPAVAGPFSVKTMDRDRGEIVLERNERYWDKVAAVDQIVLRRTDQAGMVDALRSGNDQFALYRTDETGLKRLSELGTAVRLHTIPRPYVAEVLLRPAGGVLTDERTRAGISALIDRKQLIDEGVKGGPSATLHADAQVLAPSMPGYAPTVPAAGAPGTPDPQRAQDQLTAAGYAKEAGTWRKDGKPLSLVIGSPGQQEPYATIAKKLASQLVAAGVEVRTVTPQPRDLFFGQLAMPVKTAQPTTSGATPSSTTADGPSGSGVGIDIAVVPQPVGGDPASVLASRFGCRATPQNSDDQPPAVPANSAAFCQRSLQPAIDSALSGATPVPEALATLEPELWRQNVVIPLFQLADTLAVGNGISGLTPGPPLMGPFGGAVNWTRGAK